MASPAHAQQDTTRAPADTVRADTVAAPVDTTRRDSLRADSLGARRQRRRELPEAQAIELDVPRPGRALGRRPPVRDPALAASDLVARAPGTFHYDVGAVGWPHGVSFRGRPPDRPVLTLDGMPFDDPVTGRPRYDLLPMPFMRALRVQTGAAARSAPASVHATLRPYDEGRPLTELRYRTSGFQSVGALHTQQRKVRFFGRPAFTQFTGGYFGRGADNTGFLDGKGVELRTERRLLGRLRYRRRRWAVQLTALHNRRYRGAAGGVALEPNRPLESAFFRPRPIRFPDARRRLLRTDLSATLRWETPLGERVADAAPLTVSAYWTGQTQRYRNPALTDTTRPAADTVAADTDRYGLRLRQRLTVRSPRLGAHDLTLNAHAWTDRFSGGNALPEGATRTRLHLSARDSTRLLGNAATLSAGLHAGSGQTYPSASARLARALAADTSRRAALRVFAEASLAGQPLSWAAQEGFGPLARPLPEGRTPGRVLSAEVGAQARTPSLVGPLAARLTLFAHRTTDRLDLYATDRPATARAALLGGPSHRAGATLDARWRARAERGFYLTASATGLLHERDAPPAVAVTVPQLYGRSRLGARYAFFTADLDVDAYAEGRFWSPMVGRTLHGPTGRLVVPRSADRRTLGPAGVIDLHAEAQIRTATLFFSYEHALGGTQVQPGVLTVPYYPLPTQRFRFGVYWPIFN
jgi:hypothetical protein